MKVVIYIDTFFLVNLCMNLILLTLLGKIHKEPMKAIRLLVSSGVGALGACILVICPHMNRLIRYIFLYIVLTGLMIRIAFLYRGIKRLISNIVSLYLVTFLLGGILNYIYYNSSIGAYLANLQHPDNPKKIYLTVILVTLIVATLLLPWLVSVLDDLKSRRNKICPVTVNFEGQTLELEGLIDTGNLLKEPISGKPVMIGEYDALKSIIPHEIMHYKTKLKVIPYHSIGKKEGVLYGLVFDEVIVKQDGESRCDKDVIVALYQGRLSSREEYQLILYENNEAC
ncbi:sporulation sigma-E factor processing peptidase SpoIIGA [Lachnospiraceae bacterium KM106-2]|nr:sporulation sigma-E factor processing peptidase SpoIIGA [Lachnospiraceae bacterium KM106-2]